MLALRSRFVNNANLTSLRGQPMESGVLCATGAAPWRGLNQFKMCGGGGWQSACALCGPLRRALGPCLSRDGGSAGRGAGSRCAHVVCTPRTHPQVGHQGPGPSPGHDPHSAQRSLHYDLDTPLPHEAPPHVSPGNPAQACANPITIPTPQRRPSSKVWPARAPGSDGARPQARV